MSREIKFRAWDEGNKIMHQDFQFVRSGLDGNDWILFVSDKQPIGPGSVWDKNPYFQQQLKIMQFTGLKDKNGKEIYEGDICFVVVEQKIGEDYRGTPVIEWSDDGYWMMDFPNEGRAICITEATEIEVIGNTQENPELLEASSHAG